MLGSRLAQVQSSSFFSLPQSKPVISKNQFWLFHARSVSLATSVIIITHHGLPQRTLPALPAFKCLWLDQREIIWPHPLVNDCKKKKLTHPLPEACHSRRCLHQLNGLFTLFPHLHLISDPEKNLASRLWQDGYFETLVSHFLHQPAIQIKSYSLPQHPTLQVHWPLMQWAE